MKIGVPKTLGYYLYYPLWKGFFENLGINIILSSDTTREIVDEGVKLTVNDACVPIKLFHGHVSHLLDKADFLFIPRLVSMDGIHIYCPKFLGLPDMIKSLEKDYPPILSPNFDLRKGKFQLFKGFWQAGRKFKASPIKIWKAYQQGKKEMDKFNSLLAEGFPANEALNILEGNKQKSDYQFNKNREWKVAVLGYPYIIYDPFISQRIIPRLRENGVRVVTQDMVPASKLKKYNNKLKKDLFWTFSSQVIKAFYHYLEDSQIKGIIHVTAFGCGPDFIVDKLMEMESKKKKNIAYMTLSIDEHTGEAGFVTRIEAFLDMLEFQRGVT